MPGADGSPGRIRGGLHASRDACRSLAASHSISAGHVAPLIHALIAATTGSSLP
jgi:hypothetical protein